MSHQVPSAAMHPERLGFRGSAFVFEQFLKDSLPATFVMKKGTPKTSWVSVFLPFDRRPVVSRQRTGGGESRMREVIKTIFFWWGSLGYALRLLFWCFSGGFQIVLRRF